METEQNIIKQPTDVCISLNDNITNARVLLQPMEEMLGSVTTFNNLDGSDSPAGTKNCQQLRTSARVFKKMKLDASIIPTASSVAQDKDKKESPTSKEVLKEDEKQDKVDVKSKTLRPNMAWSTEDKTHFFEAIKEHGKNFDAIHEHINKFRKKGASEFTLKTKDQVRYFYYRTWLKISKYLKFSEEVKKEAQEYYALINYGEMRRKVGAISEKNCMKLNELMYRGTTQIRSKGKSLRIKTPMCRTLRKLNQIAERPDIIDLPSHVMVELRPKDMSTWTYVQAMGQNPRVHCTLPLQRRMTDLLTCLTGRWRTYNQRAQDKILQSESNVEDLKITPDPILRLAPKPGCIIDIPNLNINEYLKNHNISLNSYEERMGIKMRGEPIWLASCNNFRSSAALKKGNKRVRADSVGSVKKENVNHSGETECDNTDDKDVSNVIDSVVNTILALKNNPEANCDDTKTEPSIDNKAVKVSDECIKCDLEREAAIENVRKGWTIHDVGNLKIGDLYLMVGSNSKIDLEYWWESPYVKTEDSNINGDENQLSFTLQRLLSLAKLHYRKERVTCPCGHVCGGANRNSAGSKTKPVTSKNVSKNSVDNKQPQLEQIVNNAEESTRLITQTAKLGEGSLFRRPILPHPTPIRPVNIDAFRAQLDSLKPRYCNRRGRAMRSKQVVQRMLPLLPKGPNNGHSLVTMKVIPQVSLASDFVPIIPNSSPMQPTPDVAQYVPMKPTQQSIALSPIPNLSETLEPMPVKPECNGNGAVVDQSVKNMDTDERRTPSPTPTISTFLDMALSSASPTHKDLLVDGDGSDVASFAAFLPGISTTTPPLSPSRMLKDDNQWLNSEVADFSLSSFLGHLESPLKPSTSVPNAPSLVGDDTRMSQDVEAQLQSLMSESSMDYTAKFADLAAQMASDLQRNK